MTPSIVRILISTSIIVYMNTHDLGGVGWLSERLMCLHLLSDSLWSMRRTTNDHFYRTSTRIPYTTDWLDRCPKFLLEWPGLVSPYHEEWIWIGLQIPGNPPIIVWIHTWHWASFSASDDVFAMAREYVAREELTVSIDTICICWPGRRALCVT